MFNYYHQGVHYLFRFVLLLFTGHCSTFSQLVIKDDIAAGITIYG